LASDSAATISSAATTVTITANTGNAVGALTCTGTTGTTITLTCAPLTSGYYTAVTAVAVTVA
jgi:hypothetical protein